MKDNLNGNLKRSSRSEFSIVSTRHVTLSYQSSKNFSFTVIDITLVMDFSVFLFVVSVASYV